MSISDTDKTDFLWKKVLFGVSKTADGTVKGGPNETIPSPLPVFGSNIWSQTSSEDIPPEPPTSSTSVVERRYGAAAARCTPDPTSPPNVAWLATETFGTPSSIEGDWLPPTFGADYVVRVWIGNPTSGPAARIFPDAVNEEWVFDYAAGVVFFPNNIPSAKNATVGSGSVSVATNGIYVEGYRYIGPKGVGAGSGSSGTFSLSPTGVVAGTYSLATVAVEADGRITFAASGVASGGGDAVDETDTLESVVLRGNESPSPILITDDTDGALTVAGGGFFARDLVVGSATGGGRLELDYEANGTTGFWLIEVQTGGAAESVLSVGVNTTSGAFRSLLRMEATGGIAGTPYEMPLYGPIIVANGPTVAMVFNRASRFASATAPLAARMLAPPTAEMIFIIRRNNSQIGTVTFTGGNSAGAASLLPNLLFAAGDILALTTSNTDATAEGLLVTLSLRYE